MSHNTQQLFYEYPLNDLTRILLKIEYLFSRLDALFQSKNSAYYNNENYLNYILNGMSLLDRTDLKQKILREIDRLLLRFCDVKRHAKMDVSILESMEKQLKHFSEFFRNLEGRISTLLSPEFVLFNSKQITNTLNDLIIDQLYYHCILQQPTNFMQQQHQIWRNSFQPLLDFIQLFFEIVRNHYTTESVEAKNGSCHVSHKQLIPGQLLQIYLTQDQTTDPSIYPEIHATPKYFLIRFLELHTSITQTTAQTISFKLHLCKF